MASSIEKQDPVEELFDSLLTGRCQISSQIQKASKHYNHVLQKLKKIQSLTPDIVNKDDLVTDVLFKLKTGRHSPTHLTQKAKLFYSSVKRKLSKYEDALLEKQIAEVGASMGTINEEEKTDTAIDNTDNLLTLKTLTNYAKKEEVLNVDEKDKQELIKVLDANAKHTTEIKRLKEELDAAYKEIDVLSAKERAQIEKEEIMKENENLRREVGKLKRENTDISNENYRLNKSLESTQADMNARQRQSDIIKAKLEDKQELERRVNEENWKLKKEQSYFRDKVENLSKHISSLNKKATRNDENERLREELEVLQAKHTQLQNEMMSTKEEVDKQLKLFHVHDTRKDREMAHLKKENEIMERENMRLESETRKIRQEFESARRQLLDKSNHIEKSKLETYERLQNQIHITSKMDAENLQLREELKSTREEMEQQIRDLTEKINQLKQDDSAKKVIQRLTEENKRLGTEVTKLMNTIRSHEKNALADVDDEDNQGPGESNSRHDAIERQTDLLIKKLSAENRSLNDEVDDLKTRLSALASHKLTADNPNITDLSDLYRPTKVAEYFKQVYDDEWTEAYEEIEKENSGDETKTIDTLTDILKDIETFCIEVSCQQFESLKSAIVNEMTYPKYKDKSGSVTAGKHRAEMSQSQEKMTEKLLKDLRKSLGILSTGPLSQVFHQVHLVDNKHDDGLVSPKLNAFVVKSLTLVWMMKMQTPPMLLLWAETGQTIDKNRFMLYTKTGDTVKQSVWPAVLLHENGSTVSKGVVQAF